MRIHWLFKYYFVAFSITLSIVYYIESTEPFVNWSLYANVSQDKVENIIYEKDCRELKILFKNEYDLNYEKNFFGFIIRKDNKSKRGLNLLKLLNFHIKKNNCS